MGQMIGLLFLGLVGVVAFLAGITGLMDNARPYYGDRSAGLLWFGVAIAGLVALVIAVLALRFG